MELVSTALSSGSVFLSFFPFLFQEKTIGLIVADRHGLILLSFLFCMPPVSHHADSWVVTCWGITFCGVIWLYETIAVFSTWANMPFNLSVKHYICYKNHVWVSVCVLDGGQWLGGHISSLHGHPLAWALLTLPYSMTVLLLLPSTWHYYISHISHF